MKRTAWLLAFAGCLLARRASAEAGEPADADAGATAPAEAPPTPDAPWSGNGPYPPPPAIVLGSPPPPELAPPEYARRPVELVPEVIFGFAHCGGGAANDARCAGLAGGIGLGATVLWRVSPYFAFGGTLNALDFRFDPPSSAGMTDASAAGVFAGLLGRVYFTDHGLIEPYLELGLGAGAVRTNAREADQLKYEETSAGGALRIGGAIEFFVSRHVRLGPAFDWTRFRISELRRCDPEQQCTDLDASSEGHGVGFTTLSARLTILVGPGL